MDEKTIKTLRGMAWQRAKGELQSYLETFWPSYDSEGKKIDDGYEQAEELINSFIQEFEDNRI